MKKIATLIKVPIKNKSRKNMLRSEAIVLNILCLYLKKKEYMCKGSEGKEDGEGNTK